MLFLLTCSAGVCHPSLGLVLRTAKPGQAIDQCGGTVQERSLLEYNTVPEIKLVNTRTVRCVCVVCCHYYAVEELPLLIISGLWLRR